MAFWFGRKSVPEARPYVPAWLQSDSGEAGRFARGYEAQLDEVYRRNPVGLRAVRLVAGLIGGLPLFGNDKAVELLRADGLLERAAAAILLHGNAYVQLVTDSRDRPAELCLLRPERVSIACGADGWPSAYLYRAGDQVTRIAGEDALGRRQLAHLKALSPSDDHYDPDRDYQAGQMRAGGGSGSREERIELPAVLSAASAKQLVEQSLARRWRAGDRIRLRLPPSRMDLKPGKAIQLASSARPWVVQSVSIEGLAVAIEAEAAPVTIPALPAAPGRAVSEPDVTIGRTELALFELPPMGEMPEAMARAYLAGSNAGLWKSVPVELALGAEPLTGVALARRAVLGVAEGTLEARTPLILDELSTVVVSLCNPAHYLLNADDDALMAGANLAILGDELIQFGRAQPQGEGIYRLSRLLRGRRGTEWAAANHIAGERFCMIDAAAMRAVELPASAVSATLTATAHGIGDVASLPTAGRPVLGESLRPPSPCHLAVRRQGAAIFLEWTRRSHRGWAWADGVGVADDPFTELYRLTVSGPAGEMAIETDSVAASLAIGELPAAAGENVTFSVSTVGPAALSRPATATIIL